MSGLFITIEGTDGAGKTTQIILLKEFLEKQGLRVLVTREPGGTLIGEKIRDIVLDQRHAEMSHTTEALLYAASRGQLVKQVIQPALNRGEIVICDRYIDSSLVYQGWGRGLGYDAVADINRFATQGLEPDITLLLEISPEISLGRIKSRGQGDRLEQEKIQFHQSVYNAYLELAERFPARIKRIDGERNVIDIQAEIQNIITSLLSKGKAQKDNSPL
ncbi:dTMP kinase [Alkaliphilus crotonatoxidans]